jgi:hypothetical protein
MSVSLPWTGVWVPDGIPAATKRLRGTAKRLAQVVGWLTLSSPAASDAKFPYRLASRPHLGPPTGRFAGSRDQRGGDT